MGEGRSGLLIVVFRFLLCMGHESLDLRLRVLHTPRVRSRRGVPWCWPKGAWSLGKRMLFYHKIYETRPMENLGMAFGRAPKIKLSWRRGGGGGGILPNPIIGSRLRYSINFSLRCACGNKGDIVITFRARIVRQFTCQVYLCLL